MDEANVRLIAETAVLRTGGRDSRRRRLGQISRKCHCPVASVCFGMGKLRAPTVQVTHFKRTSIDYELHTTAVAQSETRTPLARILRRTRTIATR